MIDVEEGQEGRRTAFAAVLKPCIREVLRFAGFSAQIDADGTSLVIREHGKDAVGYLIAI